MVAFGDFVLSVTCCSCLQHQLSARVCSELAYTHKINTLYGECSHSNVMQRNRTCFNPRKVLDGFIWLDIFIGAAGRMSTSCFVSCGIIYAGVTGASSKALAGGSSFAEVAPPVLSYQVPIADDERVLFTPQDPPDPRYRGAGMPSLRIALQNAAAYIHYEAWNRMNSGRWPACAFWNTNIFVRENRDRKPYKF